MHWIVMLAALLILILLALKARRASADLSQPIASEASFESCISTLAAQADAQGFLCIPARRALLTNLEKPIRFLNTLPREELFPASKSLCQHGRFLQQTAVETLGALQKLSSLPKSTEKQARMAMLAQELVWQTTADLSEKTLNTAIQIWQSVQPMTEAELQAFPIVLRKVLLERLASLAKECAECQRSSIAAHRMLQLLEHKRAQQAKKLFHTYAHHPSFLERLLSLEEPNERLLEWLDFSQAEAIVHQEHEQQTQRCVWVENATATLRLLHRLPWQTLLEKWSQIHQIYQADGIYADMTVQSRKAYRSVTAILARQGGLSEAKVASAAIRLCERSGSILEEHVGYYLLDEGLPQLLKQLPTHSLAIRLRLFFARHSAISDRISSWLLFAVLVLMCAFAGLPLPIYLSLAVVLWGVLRPLMLGLKKPWNPPEFLPRMQVKNLEESTQTLVVCPAVLHSAKQALALVKKLLIIHEAHRDEHLHFLLMGDFGESLTATRTTDSEIMYAAREAVKALCETTGYSFFYLQRERTCSPGGKQYHGAGGRHGNLQTLLKLIAGRPFEDSFACTTVDSDWFANRYRYVIVLNEGALLPPGSVHALIGAMLHPLNQRQKNNHRMRGYSLLLPRAKAAPHSISTRFAAFFHPYASDNGLTAILDPIPFLEASESLPYTSILVEKELAGWRFLQETTVYEDSPQTAKELMVRLCRRTFEHWRCLPKAFPLPSSRRAFTHEKLRTASRSRIWQTLASGLLPSFRLLLLAYAAATGTAWLWLCALLADPVFFLSSGFRLRLWLASLTLLPAETACHMDAFFRSLYQLGSQRSKRSTQEILPYADSCCKKPSAFLFFTLMGCGAAFGLFCLLPGASLLLCLLCAAGWAGFALSLPFLEQERFHPFRPTRYMHEVLLRLAKSTLTFFEVAITQEDHALPTARVQIDPNTGIMHRTSPADIGLYLCTLIAAQKLKLLSADEMVQRMQHTLHTLKKLSKWNGLFYHCYNTHTLEVTGENKIESEENGLLTVCLITCAQGIRSLLPELTPQQAQLAEQLDACAHAISLERLYDAEADLFFQWIDGQTGQPSDTHHELLGSEARLLSFASILLGKVPLKHWDRLNRQVTRSHALLSEYGTMAEAFVPLLFQPLTRDTLLERSCTAVARRQQRTKLGKAYGISKSCFYAFEPNLWYQQQCFGIPELALQPDIQADVLTPCASMLTLPFLPKTAFRNLLRLQILGFEGPLGLFDAADFDPVRTEGETMRMIRCHTAHHQCMVLCAICNTLENHYLIRLFSELPRVLAYQMLLEEPPPSGRSCIRSSLKRSAAGSEAPKQSMQRAGEALRFPIDAHLLHGNGTAWMIDAQGGGFISRNGTMLTQFYEYCCKPSGMRLYLRDSQSGTFWVLGDPRFAQRICFESAQAVFQQVHFNVFCELRMWIDPLTGSAIHCLTLENRSDTDRLMEICSFSEPACFTEDSAVHTRRITSCGMEAQNSRCVRLWHFLHTDVKPLMLRLQNNRNTFLGRGRSFHNPLSLGKPISALADSLGKTPAPCLSLRGQFRIPASQKSRFFFITHLAEPNEKLSHLTKRYADDAALLHTYDMAVTRCEVFGRFIGLSAEEEAEISRTIGALCYIAQPSQGGKTVLAPEELSSHGLRPALPLLLLECKGSVNKTLVHLLCKLHVFCRMNGLPVEWCIVIQSHSKAAEMQEALETLLQAGHCMQEKTVHIMVQPERELLSLLRSAARLCLHGGASLGEQLNALAHTVSARPLYRTHTDQTWTALLPPAEELLLSNPYGGFTRTEGWYQLALPCHTKTLSPYPNWLVSELFCTLTDEAGLVRSHSKGHALDDGIGSEAFYLRDAQKRLLWSVTQQPAGCEAPVRITHAPGETVYESCAFGIYARLSCITDSAFPIGLRSIQLRNEDSEPRVLECLHTHVFPLIAQLEGNAGCVCGSVPCGGYMGLYALDPQDCTVAVMNAGEFQGLWNPVPYALSTLESFPSKIGSVGILSFKVHLAPGESRALTTCIGFSETYEETQHALSIIQTEGFTERLLLVRRNWEERLGMLQFDLPDIQLSLLLGKWFPYQVWNAHLRRRPTAQPSDSNEAMYSCLMEVLALSYLQPETAKNALLLQAQNIFEKAENYGLQTKLLFLFVSSLFAETECGKCMIDEMLNAKHQTQTFHEHAIRLFESIPLGAHNLPLSQRENTAESVWLGMILAETLRLFCSLCPQEEAAWLVQQREQLLESLDRFAWNGSWYLEGWNSKGEKTESKNPDPLTQAWAVLCGVSRDRCAAAMENVWRWLKQHSGTGIGSAAGWLIMAYHQLGEEERAWELAFALLNNPSAEPYAMPDSATAAGYWYALVYQLLGLRRKGNRLSFVPVVPQAWESIRITCRYGSATYHLHASRSCTAATADGQALENGQLLLLDDNKIHEGFFPLR